MSPSPVESPRIPAIAGALVAIITLVIAFLGGVESVISSGLYGGFPDVVGVTLANAGWSIADAVLRGAVVIVVAWRVLPVRDGSGARRVLGSAAVSALAIAVVEAVLRGIAALFNAIGFDRDLFANSFPSVSGLPDVARAVVSAVAGIPVAAVQSFVLVALALLVVARHLGEIRAR